MFAVRSHDPYDPLRITGHSRCTVPIAVCNILKDESHALAGQRYYTDFRQLIWRLLESSSLSLYATAVCIED